MSILLKFSVAALATLGFSGVASALTIVEEPGSNLASFSYTVDSASKVISLYETWGTNTNSVLLKFIDWDHNFAAWRIDKYVTNETGKTWTSFTHELLQSDKSPSPNNDGLSFAQLGNPNYPRSSDKFLTVTADENHLRDYLSYTSGEVASGESVYFGYGITNRRETPQTEPFFLKQIALAGIVPEPATWALFLAGFGLVGVAIRRRERASA